MDNKQGILLETGTNEFEIIEFSVGPVNYGINVAKVKEVINIMPVTKIANAHPFVDGIFKLRGNVIPLISLARCLGVEETAGEKKVIVCEINNSLISFKVDAVYRIHRISWTQMEPAPSIIGSDLVVGVIKMSENLIILLDFEKILSEVNPEIEKKLSHVPSSAQDLVALRKTKKILIAEDSKMLRELLVNTLNVAGYQTVVCGNGLAALEKLIELRDANSNLREVLQLVITDIEMPQMDGHHLIKRIKSDEKLNYLPVVIFSSLINEDMRRKGESVGASAQITKPEIGQLINIVDKMLKVV